MSCARPSIDGDQYASGGALTNPVEGDLEVKGDVCVGHDALQGDATLKFTVDDAEWKTGIDYAEAGRPYKLRRTGGGDVITATATGDVTVNGTATAELFTSSADATIQANDAGAKIALLNGTNIVDVSGDVFFNNNVNLDANTYTSGGLFLGGELDARTPATDLNIGNANANAVVFHTHVLPNDTNSVDLGSTSKAFKLVHALRQKTNFGTQNVMLTGFDSVGDSLTTGAFNAIVGHNAGQVLTSGGLNTLIGRNAGDTLTEGSRNTCVGQRAGFNIITGENNTCIGNSTGVSSDVSGSIALGHSAEATTDNECVIGGLLLTVIRPTNICSLGTSNKPFDKLYLNPTNNTGFDFLGDTVNHTGNRLSISANPTWTALTCDGLALGTNRTQIPGANLWNTSTNKITPIAENDAMVVGIRVGLQNSSNTGSTSFRLNINNTIFIPLGTFPNTTTSDQIADKSTVMYVGSDFKTFGAAVEATSNEGATDIWGFNIMINRTHVAT